MTTKIFVRRYVLLAVVVAVCAGLVYWGVRTRREEKEPVRGLDLTEQYIEKLVGKPAPELREIKGWKNSEGLTLVGLRGKHVLLDFWGHWCGPCLRDMPHLMAIYDAFSERGLMVIGVHDDSVESIEEMDEKLARAREKIWMGRDLNFPVALDGGGRTRVAGTDTTAPGATTAAYGVRAFPTTVLIGADGKVIEIFHAPSLDDKIAKLEKILGVQAKRPEWRERFDAVYRLDDGEVLGYVAEPYIPERGDFFFRQFSRWGWFYQPLKYLPPGIPESVVLSWDENDKQVKGGMGGGRMDLMDILRDLGFYEREFEGEQALLERRVPGDWIKRDEAKRKELLAAFEEILNEKVNLSVRFVAQEVERDVFVCSGTFEFRPLSGEYGDRDLHLFTDEPDPAGEISGGGGSGGIDNFLDYIGRLGRVRVVNESKILPDERLSRRQHSSARRRLFKDNVALFEKLLQNVSKQTSVEFKKERQKEKIWLVKGAE